MSTMSENEIARFLDNCPDEFCDLVLELRRLVLENASGVAEAIKFNSLCYYRPDQPFGSIGGNVCMISARNDRVHLSFIHGAQLADPERILRGTAKAKRYIEIHTRADIRRPGVGTLLKAAITYNPLKKGNAKRLRRR